MTEQTDKTETVLDPTKIPLGMFYQFKEMKEFTPKLRTLTGSVDLVSMLASDLAHKGKEVRVVSDAEIVKELNLDPTEWEAKRSALATVAERHSLEINARETERLKGGQDGTS